MTCGVGAGRKRDGDSPRVRFLAAATAAVWLIFGLFFKVFGWVPRHRAIVAAVLGDELAAPATLLVGAAEFLIGLWVLSGLRPRACAAMQTLAIVSMNSFELWCARTLLLAPFPMLLANAAFLSAAWYVALARAGVRR